MNIMGEVIQILKQINSDISTIKLQNKDIAEQDNELKQELRIFKTEFEVEICNLKLENNNLKEENRLLKTRLDYIERKSKKFNIIIYGLKETQSDILDEGVSLLHGRFKLNVNHYDIRDAFRIGSFDESKTRPISIKLSTNWMKKEIFNKSSCLKGSGIAVSSGYIQEDSKKKFLLSQLKIERDQGHKAHLKGKNLIIDEKTYTYEEIKQRTNENS